MFPNVPGFPREHRHVVNPCADFVRDVEQAGIDFAAFQYAIQEISLVRCEVKQEGQLFPAEGNGLLNPRTYVSLA